MSITCLQSEVQINLGTGNNDGLFNATKALSIPFSATQGLMYRYNQANYTGAPVPSNIEVWATEYNMSENLAGSKLQHNDTWTHALYVSAMSHLLLSIPKVTMLINHALTNQLEFAAIDMATHCITANAIAMRLLGEASKDLITPLGWISTNSRKSVIEPPHILLFLVGSFGKEA
ncbi:MAG: hypothetical protein O2951_14975 [Bacteroidetes bacterium]|nr:hypothetical protein [Bacteroidota bacterium]